MLAYARRVGRNYVLYLQGAHEARVIASLNNGQDNGQDDGQDKGRDVG